MKITVGVLALSITPPEVPQFYLWCVKKMEILKSRKFVKKTANTFIGRDFTLARLAGLKNRSTTTQTRYDEKKIPNPLEINESQGGAIR